MPRALDATHDDAAAAVSDVVDFNLHGLVGIRLVDAAPADVRAVTRQLGSIRGRIENEPDIVVRYVESRPRAGDLRYLGLDDAAFDDSSFFLVRRDRDRLMHVALRIDKAGERTEIVCETGFGSIPFLIPTLNLTMLARGFLPMHGSAFTYSRTGVLVTGWAKGGKTEMLLGFMARGAKYVGDEWVYVDGQNARTYGIPEPIRIWDWHLDELARYRRRIGTTARARMWLTRRAGEARRVMPERIGHSDAGQFLDRALALVERQSFVRIEPERLFGHEHCVLDGRLDKVVLVLSHESREVTIEPVEADEIARRMVFSHEYERMDFLGTDLQSRFAFPDRVNPLLEKVRERETALLLRALAGKDAYVVRHPFPAPIHALVNAVLPVL